MTDKEFTDEIRKGLLIIARAMIRKYGMSWDDFMPRPKPTYQVPVPLGANQSATLPLVSEGKR